MKNILFLITIILFGSTVVANDTIVEKERPTVAVVLSGGGAKGFAHIGVLKVLEQQGIPVDLVVGTSMGSIVGGLYALGYTAQEIQDLSLSQSWEELLTDNVERQFLSRSQRINSQRYVFKIPTKSNLRIALPEGAFNGQNLINLFCHLAGNVPPETKFNEFPINYACVGTNLETGKEVVIEDGFFPNAIYSSMAIPGVFKPAEHNDYKIIDGGTANNFPADIAKRMGADIIIGVDITDALHPADSIHSIKEIMDQLIGFYSIPKDSINKSYCDVLIKPDMSGYSASSFTLDAIDSLIRRGEVAAKQSIPQIDSVKNKYQLKTKELAFNYKRDSVWEILNILLYGNKSTSNKFVLNNLNLQIPNSYCYKEIKEAIDRVYSSGFFKRIYFKLVPQQDGSKILSLYIEEKRSSSLDLGMRLNTTDAVAILINLSQLNFKQRLKNLSLNAEISSNPEINLYGEIHNGKFPTIAIDVRGKKQSHNLYSKESRASSSDVYYTQAKGELFQSFSNHARLGLNYSFEYYNGKLFLEQSNPDIKLPDKNTFFNTFSLFYEMDNLDDYYFPNKGVELHTEVNIFDDKTFTNFIPSAALRFRTQIPIYKILSLTTALNARIVFSDSYSAQKHNYVGGHDYELYFNNHLPFYGIPSMTIVDNFCSSLLLGFRVNLYNKHYISLLANTLFQSNEIGRNMDYDFNSGVALDYNYSSIIGPIGFTVAYSDWNKKVVFSANIGYWF